MSDNQKVVSMPAKNGNDKDAKKKGKKKSIGWIIGVVVLILISVTFVIPATAFSGNQSSAGVKFGSYDGKDIELTYNSYFYFQLQQLYSAYAQAYGEANANNYAYNMYYDAYKNSLVNEAYQAMAEKAGFKATASQISEAAVQSGWYSDGASRFSSEVYANASDQQKAQIVAWMQQYVPANEVETTIASAKVSSAEKNFVTSLSDKMKNFEYITVSSESYPDDAAVAYAAQNADLFQKASFTRATYATQEEAEAALAAIKAGSKTMADAVAESIDGSASQEGALNDVYRFAIEKYLEATASDAGIELFTAPAGSFVGPVNTSEGYTLFSVTAPAAAFDAANETDVAAVKAYIGAYDTELMTSALETIAAEVYADAQKDFKAAAESRGLNVTSVANAAQNPGNSQFVMSLNYSDMTIDYSTFQTINGNLAEAAAQDKAFDAQLFSSAENTVLGPVAVGGAYVIARPVAADAAADSTYLQMMLEQIASYYEQSAGASTVTDMKNAILNSDKVKDNFINGFLTAVYGM